MTAELDYGANRTTKEYTNGQRLIVLLNIVAWLVHFSNRAFLSSSVFAAFVVSTAWVTLLYVVGLAMGAGRHKHWSDRTGGHCHVNRIYSEIVVTR